MDSFVLSLDKAGRLPEGAESAGFFAFLESIGNRRLSIGFQPRRPEAVDDVNPVERDGLDVIVCLFLSPVS